ncbi:MAG: hypothetical protein R3279_03040 [Putridiphycobacter sp.]|nr:hypothetical protein [Putridiphycobacter sp.]
MVKKVEIYCAEVSILSSNVFLIAYRTDIEIELNHIKELEQTLIDLSNGGDIYTVVDSIGAYINISNEGQNFLAKEASIVIEKKIKASAVLIRNLPNRLVAKFFMVFYKPLFPIKIFAEQSAALSWLESIQKGKQPA